MTTDRLSARARMIAYLQQAGLSTARAEANVDALLAEAAVLSAAAPPTQAAVPCAVCQRVNDGSHPAMCFPPAPVDWTAKAEALLLHFTAEAHRRKWSYDRGLDDDGVPIKSEAFDALHRLGEEMRVALEKLRSLAEAPQPCPGYETVPNRCRCDCEGCKHNCAAHQPAEAPQPETEAETAAVLLASPCDACRHTLNWHRNDVGCTLALCVCSRFQPPVTAAPAVVAQPGKEG